MQKIGKINVRHFLNTNLAPSLEINDIPCYSLYVKVTFQRKSTEIKSIIGNSFFSIESAYDEYKELIDAEVNMIQSLVEDGYNKLGDKFSLRGISTICKSYHNKSVSDILDSYIFNEYNQIIIKLRSKFGRVLTFRIPRIKSSLYFEMALKLLENPIPIMHLKEKFDVVDIIEKARISNVSIVEWKYGNIKNKVKLPQEIISIIDNEIEKLIQ